MDVDEARRYHAAGAIDHLVSGAVRSGRCSGLKACHRSDSAVAYGDITTKTGCPGSIYDDAARKDNTGRLLHKRFKMAKAVHPDRHGTIDDARTIRSLSGYCFSMPAFPVQRICLPLPGGTSIVCFSGNDPPIDRRVSSDK